MHPFKFLCSVLLFLFGVNSISAQSISPLQKEKIRSLFKEWDSTHTPGGTVGVYQSGKLIFSEAYGMASLEYQVSNTVHTIYNIASVSKQVTAFSLVLLEQKGKLSLEDPVQKHLPEVPDFGETITLRHLLHHTSGLRNFQNILAMAGWRQGDPMTNDDLLRYISRQRELNFSPGTEYLYCNTGFNLATAIVERVTGQTFQEWTRKNIFLPLDMKDTGFREDMEIVHQNTATSYSGSRQEGYRQPLKFWTYLGNGNIYTTVDDLAKWLDNFRHPKVGGKLGIQTLVTPGILNNGDTLDYALGIGVGEYRGLKRYAHGGSIGGYRANLTYFPEEELGILVLSNFSGAGAGGKAQEIANILLGDQLTTEKSAEEQAVSTNSPSPDPIDLTAWAGNYYVEGFILEITEKDGQLFVFAHGQLPDPIPLTAETSKVFIAEQENLKITFLGESPQRIRLEYGSDRLVGRRLASAKTLMGLAGQYYSPELDTRYTFTIEDNRIRVEHQRHEPFFLYPSADDTLFGTAFFFSNVKIVRKGSGGVEGLRVSNGRVRNLWFKKID